MLDVLAAAPPRPTVTVTVPAVATTAGDGLPVRLRAGTHQAVVALWRAANGAAGTAVLEVHGGAGARCAPVALAPGGVVRASCRFSVGRAGQVRVVAVVDGRPVRTWVHVAA